MPSPPVLDGNAAQVRAIIEQTIKVVKETEEPKRASWPAWTSLALAFLGLVFAAGVLRSDVAVANERSAKNERRIEALESDREAIARIEAKVDVLMDERTKR